MTSFRLLTCIGVLLFGEISAQVMYRKEIRIPDIPGYLTLKCDFNMHTVFSDGNVWPTTRVEEAWQDGLDAIAITDHIEYLPHSSDIQSDHNRPYEVALPLANHLNMILIRGAEITRKMPPGHLNAIFIRNANLLERDSWFEACQEAKDQGGFIFWNHPGRKDMQPDQTVWWREHTRLHEAGLLDGVEVYSDRQFYPTAVRWARERRLTILCNSDAHEPVAMQFEGSRRPVTLVFATARSAEAIRDALRNRRTAAYFGNTLVGERRFLGPVFSNSIRVVSEKPRLENNDVKLIYIHNHSDIDFELKRSQPSVGFAATESLILKAHRTSVIEVTGTSEEVRRMPILKMNYEVSNLLTGVGEPLTVVLEVENL